MMADDWDIKRSTQGVGPLDTKIAKQEFIKSIQL